MMEEALIEAVRSFPCLWQVKSKSYKDLRAKENAWRKVCLDTDLNGDFARKKWKQLRDRFVREIRKIKKRVSGEEGPPATSSWKFFTVLSFLEDTVQHRS